MAALLNRGILVQVPSPRDNGEALLQHVGDRIYSVPVDGDDSGEPVPPGWLVQYEVDVAALCRDLRRQFELAGRPVSLVHRFLALVGSSGTGHRRDTTYFARQAAGSRLPELAIIAKADAGAGRVTLLVPVAIDPSGSELRHLQAIDVRVVCLTELARHAEAMAFESLPPWTSDDSSDARLRIDVAGGLAQLDGKEIALTAKEHAVLIVLANEAIDGAAYVSKDILAGAISPELDVGDNAIFTIIKRLRRKLLAAGAPGTPSVTIETKKKVGYRLRLEPGAIHLT